MQQKRRQKRQQPGQQSPDRRGTGGNLAHLVQWGPQAHGDRLVQLVPKVMQVRQGHEVKGDQRGHRVFRDRLVRQVLRVKRGHEVCREKQEDRARQVHRDRQVKPDHRDHKGQPEGWYPGKFTASEHTLLPQ